MTIGYYYPYLDDRVLLSLRYYQGAYKQAVLEPS